MVLEEFIASTRKYLHSTYGFSLFFLLEKHCTSIQVTIFYGKYSQLTIVTTEVLMQNSRQQMASQTTDIKKKKLKSFAVADLIQTKNQRFSNFTIRRD